MTETAIQVDGVKKHYGALEVLRGVSFSVPAGSFSAIIEKADAGRVVVQGHDLSSLDEAGMADLRRRAIGFVFQGFNLIPSLSALENTLLPTFFDKTTPVAARHRRAVGLLAQVGLGDRMHHRPSELSGGEQQRVAMARALVNEPSILLADEPTGNLDVETGAAILELLLDMSRAHATTLVVVTHDPDIAAKADTIIEMKDGRIQHDVA